jgi:hypothetical protein
VGFSGFFNEKAGKTCKPNRLPGTSSGAGLPVFFVKGLFFI